MSRTIDSLKIYINFLENPNESIDKYNYITPGAKTDYGFDKFVYGICGETLPTDEQFSSLLERIGELNSDKLHESITDSIRKAKEPMPHTNTLVWLVERSVSDFRSQGRYRPWASEVKAILPDLLHDLTHVKGELGFDVSIIDAGPEYNWIYTGMSIDDQLEHIKNKKSYVLHFKGSSGKRWDEFSLYDEGQIGFYKKILEMI